MTDSPPDDPLLDDDAGRLTRPYTASGGRTRPAARLDLLTLVKATGRGIRRHVGPDHAQVLGLCRRPVSVAEIAARVRLPATITKVLLSDLLDCGAVTVDAPAPARGDRTDRALLEAVLHGLRERL
ncbi:DUF742 domain-containing protein [Streptomyces sp. NBC_01803]|uniref:DUF742 domain-containing protein n=1 Tax=Streptomyces sp. NBC_01803 TaxID=2975946 RepID=UPI002DD8DE94|nr:DUF742 domain-containing protein [Streptomyces sp. NBC_01803]WSA43246.1 DUF742 domain-containing protein [Streptomyces sp. NBC_01803]